MMSLSFAALGRAFPISPLVSPGQIRIESLDPPLCRPSCHYAYQVVLREERVPLNNLKVSCCDFLAMATADRCDVEERDLSFFV